VPPVCDTMMVASVKLPADLAEAPLAQVADSP
jgi:hypothetical protein